MEYKYAENDNFEDFASGRVIYHMGGEPTFPVRLTLEIYERCLQYSGKKTDITLYDCCCGGAYMLTILGFLKNDTISRIYGSDIDMKSLKLAEDNLSLLTESGIRKRRAELEALYEKYNKLSHYDALQSIDRIEKLINKEIKVSAFHQNILDISDLPFIPDIVITDVPYGNMVNWTQNSNIDNISGINQIKGDTASICHIEEDTGDINQMMDALSGISGRDTIVCICSNKKQKIKTDIFQRLDKKLIGKRKFEVFMKKTYGTLACAKDYAGNKRLGDWVQLFLRGDGKNLPLADGLRDKGFICLGLYMIDIKALDVSTDTPEYLTDKASIDWFYQKTNEMIEQINRGWDMPPLIVHYHDGIYHPFDGRHRIVTLSKVGITKAAAVIVVNTEEDSISFVHETKKPGKIIVS